MKLIIDIPEGTYRRIQALVDADYFEHDICGRSMQRVANGTPLHKETVSGDLISRSVLNDIWELYKRYHRVGTNFHEFGVDLKEIIDNAPTVVATEDCISREGAINALVCRKSSETIPSVQFDNALIVIKENLTTKRPTGEWNIISLLDGYVNLRCSECGQSTRLVRDSKNEFCCIKDVRDKIVACPYCGADMRGE